MTNYHLPLLPDQTYHLFSRAIGSEKIFLAPNNYAFFLQKLKHHTGSVCQIYCYSLLPNHFHLLIKVRDERTLINHFEKVKNLTFDPELHELPTFTMKRFSNFLNSYTKAFNKTNKRKGALFMDYLKRSKAKDDYDFTAFVWYIHKNAIHHHLSEFIGEWKFDSYNSMISDAPTSLLRDEILEWFGSKEAFINFHQQEVYPKKFNFDDFE